MSSDLLDNETPLLAAVKKNTGLTMATGVIILLMGIFAVGSPFVAGKSLVLMVGILLLIGGVSQLAFAFKAGGGIWAILLGILTVIAGGYMISNPAAALATLTIFLAAYLIVSGISEAIFAFQVKPAQGWGWTLLSGILSVVLGIMIWKQFPLTGAMAIGILLGIRLIFSGMSLLMFGIAARSVVNRVS